MKGDRILSVDGSLQPQCGGCYGSIVGKIGKGRFSKEVGYVGERVCPRTVHNHLDVVVDELVLPGGYPIDGCDHEE